MKNDVSQKNIWKYDISFKFPQNDNPSKKNCT